MSSESSTATALAEQHVREFFLARQPILNRDQDLFAYELLFRSAAFGPANVVDNVSATASVIAHMSELGMGNVVGNSLGFLNIDAAVLLSDFIKFLPPDKVVLEILETVKVTPEIIQRIQQLSKAGYQFALDDVIVQTEDVRQLLPLAQVIKVDIMGTEQSALQTLSRQLKQGNKKLLAEKVETYAEFQKCLDLGFDYFQGYYFAKPLVLTGKKLSPSQMAIMQLMNQVLAEEDSADLEHTIKKDASLSLNLLRLVNSAGVSTGKRIESVRQALVMLGRQQLQRWLQILLYASVGANSNMKSPLLVLATTRGKLLELIAQKLQPNKQMFIEKSFTVGIMSLMDALFDLPMDKVLEQLTLADEVREALLNRQGEFGDMLKLAEHIERIEELDSQVVPLLQKLNLTMEDLSDLQLKAFQWSNSIAGSDN